MARRAFAGSRLERHVGAEADRVGERPQQPVEVVGHRRRTGPRRDRALVDRGRRVGHDELGVDLHPGPEAGALGAGAERAVERERPRLQLLEAQVVIRAVQVLGVRPLAVRVVLGQVDELQRHQPAAEGQRGLDRVGQPALRGRLDREPVDDHLDRVLLLLLQGRRLGELDHHAVDPGPAVALGLQLAEQLAVLPLAAADDRRKHLEPGALLQLEHPVHDRLRRLPADRAAAYRAVRPAGPRIQQPEVVVDLGDRADRRARVAGGRLLVDRDRRRQALDEVDVRLVHLAEELPRIRGQRLDVAALPLGEDRVEGEAGLARAGQAGEDDDRVAREVERDVLEVVLARASDDQAVGHSGIPSVCERARPG